MSVFTDQITITNTPLPVDTTGQSINVGNFPATQPVSGTITVANPGLTDTQLRATPVPVSGSLTTSPVTSNSATITQVTVTTTNSTILAANAARKKAILFVATQNTLIKFGATASATSFTYKVTSAGTTIEIPIWTGQIDAITTGGTSVVTVTEMV